MKNGYTAYLFDVKINADELKKQGVSCVVTNDVNFKADGIEVFSNIIYVPEFDDKLITTAFEESVETGKPLFIRTPRTLFELGAMTELHKCTPLELLESIGVLDKKAHLVGCNHLDSIDLKLITTYNVEIVLEFETAVEEAEGFPELYAMLKRGILPGLSITKSINKAMYLAKNVAGMLLADRNAVSDDIIIKMARKKFEGEN